VVGVGRTGTGAVPSLSYPALQAPRCGYSIRDGGRVTGVSGWDPGHIYCGNGGPTPPAHGPWRSGWPLMPSYGGRLGGGAVCPLCRETASSEAEMSHLPEGRSTSLERGGDVLRGRGS